MEITLLKRSLNVLAPCLRPFRCARRSRTSGATTGGSILLSAAMAWSLPAMALSQVPDVSSLLQQPGLIWHLTETMEVGGVPFVIMSFSAQAKPVGVAQALFESSGLFQYVQALPGRLLLSGLDAEHHSIADITVRGAGSAGYVSIMSTNKTSAAADGTGEFSDYRKWLPADAVRIFEHSSMLGEARSTQAGFSTVLPPDRAGQHLRTELTAAGWQINPEDYGLPYVWRWKKQSRRLTVHASPQDGGAALFINEVNNGHEP